ncbi:AMP-binding protein [Oricola cellulosilytica]|uniref:Long-chain fatty acid--CoA ligase n=1 Tax=Oricola cellulosilytica TaxID=1429082 RepID=A0A4R0PG47_9HYPH|nr:AMP-binding protein [Oricola cellulosilytica]TCD15385.1 long-chain fatty acid--CoA ligase [Oricola cellulosilytica]
MKDQWQYSEGSGLALVDGASGQSIRFNELTQAAEDTATQLEHWRKRTLHFVLTRNRVPHALIIIAAFRSGVPIALVDPEADRAVLHSLIDRYRPESVVGCAEDIAKFEFENLRVHSVSGIMAQAIRNGDDTGATSIHPDLACLLSTSGSTGTPKFVRLTRRNLVTNATDIGRVLGLDEKVCSFAHLKLHYSFGLSVLNSQLIAGGTCVLSDAAVVEPAFWEQMRRHKATLLPCVPFHCEYLSKLGLRRLNLPTLNTVIQAGGACRRDALRGIHSDLTERNGGVFVMYGQTEASPRMTTLDSPDFFDHSDSVGKPMPSGEITILDPDGYPCKAGSTGEVVYQGPNVALGYATNRADLAKGDEFNGILKTGDLGFLSPEGFLTLRGRIARFAKVQGVRVSLDDVEALASKEIGQPCYAISAGEQIHLYVEDVRPVQDVARFKSQLKELSLKLRLPLGTIIVKNIETVPRKANGKPDCAKLASLNAIQ